MGRAEWLEYVQALGIAVVLAFIIIVFVAQAFVVQGSSMEPTLHDSERVLVDKMTYRFRDPQRGEIVVFKYPLDPSHRFIKRIIGVPGDRVYIQGGLVYVNGVPLTETYIKAKPDRDWGPEVTVPSDRYFVLGDNRNNSEDSRYPDVGFVPRSYLVGRALFIFWPLNRMAWLHTPALTEQIQGGKQGFQKLPSHAG